MGPGRAPSARERTVTMTDKKHPTPEEIQKEFEDFVEYEFSSLRAIMYLSGMV